MTSGRYLIWGGTTVVVLALAVVALTVFVDPYRTFGTPTLRGWTELKPRIYQQAGLAKTYQLDRVAPRTVLLGNSRVEIGFDPASALWPTNAQPVFNAAEAGKDLFTALIMLQEAIAVGHLKTAVLGVDFQDFLQRSYNGNSGLRPSGPDELRLLVDRSGRPNHARFLQVWRDWVTSTLTIDAVTDSLETLLDQSSYASTTMTPSGFNPLHEYRLYAARDGYYALFAHSANMYAEQYSRYALPNFSDPSTIANARYLREILDLANTHRIRLILFTPPYHAKYLEMLHRMGFWGSFRAWQRTLAHLVDDARHRGANVTLFDCSAYNSFTTEAVPPAGDEGATMKWYWEPGHYKSALGDELLRLFFDGSGPGYRLTVDDVDSILAQTEDQRAEYIGRNSAAAILRNSQKSR